VTCKKDDKSSSSKLHIDKDVGLSSKYGLIVNTGHAHAIWHARDVPQSLAHCVGTAQSKVKLTPK